MDLDLKKYLPASTNKGLNFPEATKVPSILLCLFCSFIKASIFLL